LTPQPPSDYHGWFDVIKKQGTNFLAVLRLSGEVTKPVVKIAQTQSQCINSGAVRTVASETEA